MDYEKDYENSAASCYRALTADDISTHGAKYLLDRVFRRLYERNGTHPAEMPENTKAMLVVSSCLVAIEQEEKQRIKY